MSIHTYGTGEAGEQLTVQVWKTFFESAANVSLTSYADTAPEESESQLEMDESVNHATTAEASTATATVPDDDDLEPTSDSILGQSTPVGNADSRPSWPSGPGAGQSAGARSPRPPTTPYLDSSPTSGQDKTPARSRGRKQDMLLHRVLDSNYRLRATPIKPTPSRFDAPSSSRRGPATGGDNDDDDDDDDLPPGLSPPVTMQFSMAPSRILKTPAREAARLLVRDMLQSAGAGMDDKSGETSNASSARPNAPEMRRLFVGHQGSPGRQPPSDQDNSYL